MNACPQTPAHDEQRNARDAVKRKHPDEEIHLGIPTPEDPCGVIHREQGSQSEDVRDAFHDVLNIAERSSAGTAGAGLSVETGWRVKVTESMADRATPAVVQPRLVR